MLNVKDLTFDEVKEWLPKRPREAHKGLFGRVLVIGGNYGMPGAVRLASEAALRMGAGLVTVITRRLHVSIVVSSRPEVLCYGVGWRLSVVNECLKRSTMVVIGPGLGQSIWSKRLFNRVLQTSLPILVDADGLNLLAQQRHYVAKRTNWILTPHPKEAARLLGVSVEDVQSNRLQAVSMLQKQYGGVAVLKGSNSLVATVHQPIQRCLAGNPGMASAGMGDVLSGIIAGLSAQGLGLYQAAQAGVLIHARAGDKAVLKYGERGLLASDLLLELQ